MRYYAGLFAASFLVCTAQAHVPSPSLENDVTINNRAAAAPRPCNTVARPHPPRALHCNDAGSVKRENVLEQSRAASQTACRDLCLDARSCISFSYNSGTLLCKLYPLTVDQQRFTRDSASTTAFWNRKCYKITCPRCDVGQKFCPPGQCTDVQTDTANCGSCGNDCNALVLGSVCSAGSCACPAPTKECSDGCKDTTEDNLNCGQCDNPCDIQGGQNCASGTCQCPANQKYCDVNTGCIDTNTNDHCGDCGVSCGQNENCSNGASCTCDTGFGRCNSLDCIPTDTNENCGQCGVTCGTNEHCDGSSCVCDENFTKCGTKCVNTAIDAQNCGVCFAVCYSPNTCSDSTCNPPCPDC